MPASRDAIDEWLSGSLAHARARLGDAFEQSHDRAPPWRFAWREGAGWTAGAIAASMDGVGRRYPLLLARDGVVGDEVESVAAQAEELLYCALAEGWEADRLHRAALAIAPARAEPWYHGEGWWTVDTGGLIAARLDGARPDGVWMAMLTMGQGNA